MSRLRRDDSSSDDYGTPIRNTTKQVRPVAHSHSGGHHWHFPDPGYYAAANVWPQLYGKRSRTSSKSGQPAPVVNNYYEDLSRSRNRSRDRRRDSSRSSSHHSHSHHHHHQYPSFGVDEMIELKLEDMEKEDEDRQMAITRGIREAKREEEDKRIERERIVLEAKLEEEKKKRRDEDNEKKVIAAWKKKEQKRKAQDILHN